MIKTNPTCGCGEESACNEVELQCDPCCRCVPQRLCATFESYGCSCDGAAAMLLLTGDSAYTGTLACGDSSLDLRVVLERDVYNKCYWRVLAEQAYLDQRFEIGSGQQSCEKPEFSVSVLFGGCNGTLKFKRHEYVKVAGSLTPNCEVIPFCGDCECTCDALCVAVSLAPDGSGRVMLCKDELLLAAGGGAPSWSGTLNCGIKNVSVSLSLSRDAYDGSCWISGSAGDYTLWPIRVPDCSQISAGWQMEDGATVIAICKSCACEELIPAMCCPGRCNPWVTYCDNPMPLTLDIALTMTVPVVDPLTGADTWCANFTGLLWLSPAGHYIGQAYASCNNFCGTTPRNMGLKIQTMCSGRTSEGASVWGTSIEGWSDVYTGPFGCAPPPEISGMAIEAGSCDPVLITALWPEFNCDFRCTIPLMGIDKIYGPIKWSLVISE